MKALLSDKKIQRLIIWTVAIIILAIILVLVIIPGVQNSQFSKLKKYGSEASIGEALKRKQEISDSRFYQTKGFLESEDAQIYRIGDFTINVRGKSQQKVILNLSVQYGNSDVPKELESKNPVIRNAIISTVSDAQYLQSRSGKELLKERLKDDLNQVVGSGEITDVYFNRFLIQ